MQRSSVFVITAGSACIIVSGVSVAMALQRTFAQSLISTCGQGLDLAAQLDFNSSPTQLHFGAPSGAYVRGAIVGNALLLAACVGIAGTAVVIYSFIAQQRSCESWSRILEALALPGRLYLPYSMVAVPIAISSTELANSNGNGSDKFIAGLGFVVAFTPAAAILFGTTTFFRGQSRRNGHWRTKSLSASPVHQCFAFFLPRYEWVDARQRWHGFVSRWSSLFDPYGRRRQWFGVIETGTGLATAVLAGLTPIDGNDSTCSFLQTAAAAVAAAFFVAVVALRPYSAQSDFALSVMNSGLTALASILGIAGTDTSSVASAQIVMNNFGTAAMVIAFCVDERLDSFIEQVRQVVKNTSVVAQVNWLTMHRRHGKRPSLRPSTKRIGEDAAAMLAAEFRGRHLNEPCPAESSRVALACIICTICDERQSINRFNTHSAASLATPEPFT